MQDNFWNSTDSCLKTMMCTSEELRKTPARHCGNTARCYANRDPLSLVHQPLVFHDYRVFIYSDMYAHKQSSVLKMINNMKLSLKFKSMDALYKVLYRVILNPSKDVQDLVLNQLKTFPTSFVGMHIRSAGRLANKKEKAYWITSSELPRLHSFISNTIQKKHFPRDVYLCTDSDTIEEYLKLKLPDINFLPRLSLKRYHSNKIATTDVMKGALVDAFVAAQSSSIIYTKDSSFSIIVLNLCKSTKRIDIPFRKRK